MYKGVLALFSGSLLGKIIGFLRELIIASLYGTSIAVGALRVAQSATLVPIHFFTSDTLNAGFIPLYNRYKKSNLKKAQSLFWIIKIALLLLSFIIFYFLFYYANVVINIVAPGFNEKEKQIAINFLQIMSFGVPFYIISSLYSYLAIANNSYFLASIRPTIQSIGIIVSTLLSYYFNNILLLAWGFSAAYFVFFILAFWQLKKESLFAFYLEGIKDIISEFWRLIKPLLLLPIFLQGNILVEKMVSSYMGVKVVASVEYAKFITETGVVLLAVPFGLVGLSTLSAIPFEEAKQKLLKIIPAILILTVPISLFLIIYSDLIVTLIFKRGAFNQEDVILTKTILIGLSIGFWAQVVSYIMIKALNAQHKNKKVVLFMGVALFINAIFNLLFYKIFGAVTIGIGVTLYGLILFFLTIWSFGFLKEILKVTVILIFASIFYYFLSSMFSFKGWIEVLLSILIFLFYWGLVLVFIPSLKSSLLLVYKWRLKK